MNKCTGCSNNWGYCRMDRPEYQPGADLRDLPMDSTPYKRRRILQWLTFAVLLASNAITLAVLAWVWPW